MKSTDVAEIAKRVASAVGLFALAFEASLQSMQDASEAHEKLGAASNQKDGEAQ